MSSQRFGRVQRATALLPLALLSAAWTASVAGVGTTSVTVSAETPTGTLPDGTRVPTEAIEAPASVSSPDEVAPGIRGSSTAKVVATASTSGIPSAALSAYQRAETVINSADKTCNLTWQLVAAIGRVESDHGRTNGNRLDDDGVAQPGIYGIALDGQNNTAVIRDSDGGELDRDTKFDRAVGPMQFIPSTWSVVGVDSDGDAQRNPQDIDDAALASAVYLCSGDDDLSTLRGQRDAVQRYNHSAEYVDLVLSIMNAYLEGEFTSVPNGTTAAGVLVAEPDTFVPSPGAGGGVQGSGPAPAPQQQPSSSGQDVEPEGGNQAAPPPPAPAPTPTPAPQQPAPSTPPTPETGTGGGTTGGPVTAPSPNVPPAPTTGNEPVDEALTRTQAVAQCLADGLVNDPLNSAAFDQCVEDYMNP